MKVNNPNTIYKQKQGFNNYVKEMSQNLSDDIDKEILQKLINEVKQNPNKSKYHK